MPTIKMNAQTIKGLPGPARPGQQIEYLDADHPGFGLRIAYGGSRSWFFFYRYQGRTRRLTIGGYPALGLADAREHARNARTDLANGIDPAAKKQELRCAETFGELSALYLEKWAKKPDATGRPRKRSWADDERKIEKELLPNWRHLKATAITRRDVRELVESIADRPAPIQANRVLALVRNIFNFGIAQEIVSANPCAQLDPPGEENRKDRVLNDDEIRAVWRALDAEEEAGRAHISAFFKLRLLTALRGQEVGMLRWSDIDASDRVGTQPADVAKNGLSHRVPLAPQAWTIVQNLRLLEDVRVTELNRQIDETNARGPEMAAGRQPA
jgi:integrase